MSALTFEYGVIVAFPLVKRCFEIPRPAFLLDNPFLFVNDSNFFQNSSIHTPDVELTRFFL